MENNLSQERLEELLDQAVREVTEQTAGVRLCRSGEPPDGDLCTVYISFHKGFHSSLSLCADAALLSRMAQNAMYTDTVSPQDLEDFSKEYFNILCGKIAALLFQATQVAARFSVPSFHRGRYVPEDRLCQFVLTYSGGERQSAQLTHHIPRTQAAP